MNILSAGAAKGLLHTIAANAGIELDGEFGAVGAIRDRLNAGARCDVIVLTASMIAELAAAGVVDEGSVLALGRVHTGIALPSSRAAMQVASVESLQSLCENASKLYFPDPVRATAGIHCLKVLTALGLNESHRDRFATFPNGATAMRAMADSGDAHAIGITQCSEILYTAGVQYAGALPAPYALSTIYTAGTIRTAQNEPEARRLLAALSSPSNTKIVREAGFDVV